MKLWLFISIASILIFSGCSRRSYTSKLQQVNARQAILIQQQQAQLETLKASMKARAKARRKYRIKKKTPIIPTAPKKNIKLKKVEDNNYSSGYMYPGAKPKKRKEVTPIEPLAAANTIMNKTECISMIGQAKFDKYTQMFGSEAASLKRCKMLKAMK